MKTGFRQIISSLILAGAVLAAGFFPTAALAQDRASGDCRVTVVDETGAPVAGAAVYVKGSTNLGQTASADGVCTFSAIPSDAVLVASCLGYDDAEAPVRGKNSVRIVMQSSNLALDELVVVGYGAMRKRDLSGSVAQVKGDAIKEFSTASLGSALQGRVTGVQVNQNSGQPGATMQIRIRGNNSIKGSNDPLWIINGFPGDPNMLNSADIESIEILKDASATAIYGSRGANGVIMVTTTSASEGKISVEYNGSVGVQTVIGRIDMMNADEYMQYLNEKAAINNLPATYTKEQMESNTVNTDWQSLIFRPGLITDHAVNVRGGSRNFQSAMGISYFDQEGIIRNSGYRRVSVNTSLRYNVAKWLSLEGNIIFSRSDRDQLDGSGTVYAALAASPLATVRKANGEYNDFTDQPTSEKNAVAKIEAIQNRWVSNRLMANGGVTFKPVDGLSIKISANLLNKDNRQDYYVPLAYKEDYTGTASITMAGTTHFTSNNIVTYDRQIGKHHINAMGGATFETNTEKRVSTGEATGFLSDVAGTYDINSAANKAIPESSYSNWKMLSFLGRVNYNYDDRYLLTVNFRADGSSRYSKGNKWGYFPSAAAAWRIRQEEFMRNVDWISELKLRAGFGVTGSTAIDPYRTFDLLESVNMVMDGKTTVGFSPLSTYYGSLRWETTSQTDIGLDLAFFNHRLKLTADFYYKYTSNLLNDVELPRSSGYTTSLQNIGAVSNTGFELQADGRIIDGPVKWDLGANFTLNRNKVVKLYDGKDIFGEQVSTPSGQVSGQLNVLREGYPMYVFCGYVEDGYDENGMIRYLDKDEDGKITAADRYLIGNPNPDFLLNFNTTVRWKGLSLSAFFQGVFGNEIYGISMSTFMYRYGYNANAMKDLLGNYWTPENPNAKYPNLLTNINLMLSDRYVYDGSYLRLKNLELGYDIPCGKVLSKARVYISGQNLFTITKYPFWDPDVNSKGGGTSLAQGVDTAVYPSARGYSIGCKLTF